MEKEVIFGHSPDSDDAFMYYGIASGNVKLDNFKISHLMEDIESLNIRSEKGELDVTAISIAHYPKNYGQVSNNELRIFSWQKLWPYSCIKKL